MKVKNNIILKNYILTLKDLLWIGVGDNYKYFNCSKTINYKCNEMLKIDIDYANNCVLIINNDRREYENKGG